MKFVAIRDEGGTFEFPTFQAWLKTFNSHNAIGIWWFNKAYTVFDWTLWTLARSRRQSKLKAFLYSVRTTHRQYYA